VLICVIVAIANTGKNSSSSTSTATPQRTAVVAASMPSWATPTPEPSAIENQTEVRRAIPVIASPTSTPYAEIPSPTDEEAIAAFNALQDQLGRPHIDRLYYTGSTDSYNWTGPKNHKRMSMKRRQFNIEIWRPYWMKNHANSKASPSSETTPTSGNKTEDEILAQQWKEVEKNPNMHYPAQDAKPSPTETYVPEQPEYYMMPDNKPESERSINLPSFDVNKLVAHPKTNWEAFSDNQLEMAAIALADYYVKKHGRPKDPDTLGSELAVAHHLVDDQWFTFEHAFANECIESDDE
jgi:hypothetical protein